MDLIWAEAKLQSYLHICDQVKRAVPSGQGWNDEAERWNREAELMIATVQSILRAVEPDDVTPLMPPSYASGHGELRVRRGLGAVRDLDEINRHMHPDAPDISADSLHPLIWKAASVLWSTEEYRVAVGQASLALSTSLKSRTNSLLTDRKLVQDVFSPDSPKPGKTRLHFAGGKDDAWQSRQQGLHLLAQGAFAGIRNASAHDDETWSQETALEYLTVLSVVARWADLTVTVSG